MLDKFKEFLSSAFEKHRRGDRFELISSNAVYFIQADVSYSEVPQSCSTYLGDQNWTETHATVNGFECCTEDGDRFHLDNESEVLLTEKLEL